MINSIKVFRLKEDFYEKRFKDMSQILNNHGGTRPYFVGFNYNNNFICMPLRSNSKSVPSQYKLTYSSDNLARTPKKNRENPACDTTKALVLSSDEIEFNKLPVSIDRGLFAYLRENKDVIETKFFNLIDNYTTDIANNKTYSNIVKFSTLQYFHAELGLDSIIEEKKRDIAIDILLSDGDNNKFQELKESTSTTNYKLIAGIEMLKEFGDLSKTINGKDYIINTNDLHNPKITFSDEDTVYLNDMRENPDYYIDKYLNSNHEQKKQKNVDSLEL